MDEPEDFTLSEISQPQWKILYDFHLHKVLIIVVKTIEIKVEWCLPVTGGEGGGGAIV